MNRLVKNVTALAVVMGAVVAFQNCAPQQLRGQEGEVLAVGKGSSSSRGGSVLAGASLKEPAVVNSSADIFQVITSSSTQAKQDCSVQGAEIYSRVVNAPANVLLCMEFILDVPAGHPRQGEQGFCDSSEKFTSPNPNEWQYNASIREWSAKPYVLKNSELIVPGSYWLVAKDQTGQIQRSAEIVVKRTGYGDCIVGSPNYPASQGSTCGWIGIVAGPEATPAQACSLANQGAKAVNDRGTAFTCICK